MSHYVLVKFFVDGTRYFQLDIKIDQECIIIFKESLTFYEPESNENLATK